MKQNIFHFYNVYVTFSTENCFVQEQQIIKTF